MSFRALSSGNVGGPTQTVTLPVGAQVGDTLLAIVGFSDTGALTINSVPAGWTAIQSSPQARVNDMVVGAWLRIFQSGDPTSWDWGFSGSPTGTGIFGCWCGNQDPSASLDDSSVTSQATLTTLTNGSVTTTRAGDTVVMLGMSDGANPMTPVAGFTKRIDSNGVVLADNGSFGIGATGTKTLGLTANSLGAVSFMVALKAQLPVVSLPNSRAGRFPIQQRY